MSRVLRREAAGMSLTRILTAAGSFVTLGLVAHYLDQQDFLVYAAITATFGVYTLLDLGVGAAAQRLANKSIHPDVWTNAALTILGIELAVSPVLVAIAVVLPHTGVLLCCLGVAMVWMPLSLIERWRAARQEVWWNAALSLASTTAAIAMTAVLIGCDVGLMLAVVPIASLTLAHLVHVVLAVRQHGSFCIPRVPNRSDMADLLRPGLVFLSVQICSVAIFQADIVFAAFLSSASEASGFAVALRIMVAGSAVLGAATNAVWPHLAKARQEGTIDVGVRKASRLVGVVVAALLVGAAVAGVGAFDWLMLFVFDDQAPSSAMVALAAVFLAVFTVMNTLLQVMSAFDWLRPQVFCAWACTSLKVIVTPILLTTSSVLAVLASGSVVVLLSMVIPCSMVVHTRISDSDAATEPAKSLNELEVT